MCGRYVLTASPQLLLSDWLGLVGDEFQEAMDDFEEPGPRYNFGPAQLGPILRMVGGRPRLENARWGLLPGWVEDFKKAPMLNNARSDTVFEKASFRMPILRQRCAIPTSGFYEWEQTLPAGAPKGAKRQPWWFKVSGEELTVMAGLWTAWQAPGSEQPPIISYTVVTTEPNALVEQVHDRMPVILPREALRTWLDPGQRDPKVIAQLLRPYPADLMSAAKVSKRLGTVANEGPDLLNPEDEPPQAASGGQLGLFQ